MSVNARSAIHEFHIQGQPQNLKNNTIHGLPSIAGNLSFTLLCALSPTIGGSRTGFGGGGGVCHDENALPHCTFAKGFWKPPPSPCPASAPGLSRDVYDGSDFGKEGSDTFPRPALWSAILVPSLLNMIAVGETEMTVVERNGVRKRRWGFSTYTLAEWLICSELRGRGFAGPVWSAAA